MIVPQCRSLAVIVNLGLSVDQVLVTWLNHSPNYEEVTKWYIGWKALIPEKLVGHAMVRG